MPLLQKANFNDRNNLGEFLNLKNLRGLAVEVGTHRGDYAEIFLNQWEGERLFCVDPWYTDEFYASQAKFLWGNGNREDDYQEAINRLMVFGHRKKLIRKKSHEATQLFDEETLDFVYLDGDHSFEAVSTDLKLWYPKLKSGGVIAGHDFICPGENVQDDWGTQIQPAVFRFADKYSLIIHIIVETLSLPWSYYLVKP